MTDLAFASIAELEAWLRAHGVDLDAPTRPGAKRPADLWAEYLAGESRFRDDPPRRLVTVVALDIRRGDQSLVELAQVLADDSRRVRLLPPSEKRKAGESVEATALRCAAEELGLAAADMELRPAERPPRVRVIPAPSYPGLQTEYTVHTVPAVTDALPDSDFALDNSAAQVGDPVARHEWGWRRLDEPTDSAG